mmetsp:Transcript_97109/g.279499  ORF Transcript_97109/g.279499 Transcript_97109/m.279499 type:complete len:246 (+) Transcript_97109:298-1035(+)
MCKPSKRLVAMKGSRPGSPMSSVARTVNLSAVTSRTEKRFDSFTGPHFAASGSFGAVPGGSTGPAPAPKSGRSISSMELTAASSTSTRWSASSARVRLRTPAAPCAQPNATNTIAPIEATDASDAGQMVRPSLDSPTPMLLTSRSSKTRATPTPKQMYRRRGTDRCSRASNNEPGFIRSATKAWDNSAANTPLFSPQPRGACICLNTSSDAQKSMAANNLWSKAIKRVKCPIEMPMSIRMCKAQE